MTAFVLKIIALASMIIDHTGVILRPLFGTTIMTIIGRIAFPLYAFLIAEGCRKTRDIKKFMIRLFIFALISEIPFDLLFENAHAHNLYPRTILSFRSQNVMFTLFLGALSVYIYQEAKKRPNAQWLGLLGIASAFTAGYFGHTDYGATGVIMIFSLYIAPKRYLQTLVMTAGIIYLYHGNLSLFNLQLIGSAMLSVVLVILYNGKRGIGLKWLFYVAYPLHLLVLAGIWFLVIMVQ